MSSWNGNKQRLPVVMLDAVIFPSIVEYMGTQSSEGGDDLLFIHHSVGENWLNSGQHDALRSKPYVDERSEIYYGTDVRPDAGRPDSLRAVPGDLTDMHHWILWFNDYLKAIKEHGTLTGAAGSSCSREEIFAATSDVLFVFVPAPPLHYAPGDATTDANGHRAWLFNNWLREEWLPTYNATHPDLNNVAVFDFFDVLAYPDDPSEHPNRLRAEYGGESGDSHPNGAGNAAATAVCATYFDNFFDQAWSHYAKAVEAKLGNAGS
jgi:hypothetical protein